MKRDPMDPTAPKRTVLVTMPLAGVPVVVCNAHNREGLPCKVDAIPGGLVCRFHGGSAPAVRDAARQRLRGMVPIALDAMLDLAAGAESEAVRQRAAADILDRVGLKAADELIVTPAEQSNEALDEAIMAALERRRAPVNPALDPATPSDVDGAT